MKKIVILILVTFITCISFTQGARNSIISKVDVVLGSEADSSSHLAYSHWPITWEEFQGMPDTTSPWDAMLYSGISLRYEYKRSKGATKVRVVVCPYMNKEKSWVKQDGLNAFTLLHEQKHFDITALVARELAERIRNSVFNNADFKTTISSLHAEAMRSLEELQHLYDEETAHGFRSAQQEAWNKKLEEEPALTVALNG